MYRFLAEKLFFGLTGVLLTNPKSSEMLQPFSFFFGGGVYKYFYTSYIRPWGLVDRVARRVCSNLVFFASVGTELPASSSGYEPQKKNGTPIFL